MHIYYTVGLLGQGRTGQAASGPQRERGIVTGEGLTLPHLAPHSYHAKTAGEIISNILQVKNPIEEQEKRELAFRGKLPRPLP